MAEFHRLSTLGENPIMSRPRIAIDMDQVLARIEPKFHEIFRRDAGRPIRVEEYAGGKIYEVPGGEHIRDYLFEKGFFRDLPVMPGSQEVVQELQHDYDIYVVTAAMEFRNSFEDKYDWLQEHFSFIPWKNIVFCGDKSIVEADYLIDDHAYNLESFRGTPLLYTASHNRNEQRFHRVNNWQEIRAYFREQTNASIAEME